MATKLSQAHRAAQLQLGAVAIRQLRAIWSLLDPTDLDGSFENWLIAVIALVEAQRRASATIAATYVSTLRGFELGLAADHFTPIIADHVDRAALATSMLVTGPVSIRANLGRMPLAQALDIAEGRTAASAMRHALNGGRETIVNSVATDRRAKGWARVASGTACSFCSMLADRGPVYGPESGNFEAHDGCTCTAEPVYR